MHTQVRRKSQREELQSLEGSQKAHLSKKLVTIQTDLALPPVRCARTVPPLHSPLSAHCLTAHHHAAGWHGRSCGCNRHGRSSCRA